MAQATLSVPDISCAHCEKTITQTLAPQAGVKSVRVDIPAKQVHLEYDESQIDLAQVGALLDEEGYPVAATQ
ncbi:MAG: heavy-metal-associated domain-containing protein [Chloroflexi bacterium]|nr:heavy-metal-associated domain-containing protein [Chloroflexota bacterium]